MRALAGDVRELSRGATANRGVMGRCIQIAAVGAVLCVASPAAAQAPFRLEEATIVSIRSAFASGQLTCTRLTRLYLDRIEAYNLKGPSLHAIITVNPRAMEDAAGMDGQYQANRAGVGTLHCIPLVLKDNFNTADMPTTGGNVGMKDSRPSADAFIVAKLRGAGALILARRTCRNSRAAACRNR